MKAPTIAPFRRIVWPLAIAQIIMWAAMYYLFPALLLEWERDLGCVPGTARILKGEPSTVGVRCLTSP